MSNITKTVDNGIVVFTVSITRWSANKKLRVQHTKAKAEDLPPADIASLGVRKVFNPKALAPFEAIRKETERLCFNEGTSFFGGVAIPKSEAEEFAKKLGALKDRFDQAKAEFERSYADNLEAWRAAHPGWENALEGELSVEEAIRRFHYGFHAVEIVVAGGQSEQVNSELGKHIESSKGAFIGKLYAEISQMASTYCKDSLLGKEKATVRGLSSLHSIKKKLNGLAFLDKRIRPLVEMIDKVLAQMPASGSIEGAELAMLLGVTSILSNQDMMQGYGEQVSAGKDANSLFASMTSPKQSAEEEKKPAPTLVPGIPQFKPVVSARVPPVPSITPPVSRGWGVIPSRASVAVAA